MRYENLTKYQWSRVEGCRCPLCGNPITKLDDFQQIKMKYGKAILYYNFHSNCLLTLKFPSQLGKEEEYEKEEVKEAVI